MNKFANLILAILVVTWFDNLLDLSDFIKEIYEKGYELESIKVDHDSPFKYRLVFENNLDYYND